MSRIFEIKVRGYVRLIEGGRMTLEDVPEEFKDAVEDKLSNPSSL